MVVTLEYLQSKNIAHRDIKPGNIMLDEEFNVKLIDFGDAKVVDKYEWLDDSKSNTSKLSKHLQLMEVVSESSGRSFFSKYLNEKNAKP